MPVHRQRIGAAHAVVAVDVAQMGEIDGVLCRFLGMAGKSRGPDVEAGIAGLVRRFSGQVPLRGPSADAPPGKDQPGDVPGLEYPQPGRFGRGAKGIGHALAVGVVFKAVERADKLAITNKPTGVGSQIGPQVRAVSLGDADAVVAVGPHHDVLAHPGLLDELGPLDGRTAGDEIPALGKRGGQRGVRQLRAAIGHHLILLTGGCLLSVLQGQEVDREGLDLGLPVRRFSQWHDYELGSAGLDERLDLGAQFLAARRH